MALEFELKSVESLIFRSDVVAIGKFRCPVAHDLFRDSGPCSNNTFVFPRTSTIIRHDGGRSFTATPNCATLYNRMQRYTRTAVSTIDASDWYVVADDVLFDAIAGYDQRAMSRDRAFTRTHVPISSRTYLRQRRLFDLTRERFIDPFEIEDGVLRLLGEILDELYGRSEEPAIRDEIEYVKHAIASAPARNIPLRELSTATSTSPFHLCRAFRKATGMSMTTYRHALRLRRSLDLLRRRLDLSTIALELGYASHSHFSAAFRRHFGVTPSSLRASHALPASGVL